MKQSKDPFEAAFVESPPESPVEIEAEVDAEAQNPASSSGVAQVTQAQEDDGLGKKPSRTGTGTSGGGGGGKNKDDEEEEEEDNMDVELTKLQPTGDPQKMAKMQSVTSLFTPISFYTIIIS